MQKTSPSTRPGSHFHLIDVIDTSSKVFASLFYVIETVCYGIVLRSEAGCAGPQANLPSRCRANKRVAPCNQPRRSVR
jgi:hypothetical protein